MAGGFVKIDIEDNSDKVGEALQRLAARVGRLTPVFRDIGEYLHQAHEERFDAQKDPQGNPWQPLSERYKARKKRNADKILVLDDLLGGTLRYQATADSLLFGTDRIYGATHQFGDDDRGIPARPFLGLSRDDEAEALRLIEEHLIDAVSGAVSAQATGKI